MKRILIITPTKKELASIIEKMSYKEPLWIYKTDSVSISLLVSGIGAPLTMYSLMDILQIYSFDLLIQAGIAGSFNENLTLGDLVLVKEDVFADLLIEDNDGYKDISDLGFDDYQKSPFNDGSLQVDLPLVFNEKLTEVKAITVNTVSGTKKTALKWKSMYSPDIETMEGAAFYFVSKKMNIPALQIRSISNIVANRNTKNWDVALAIRKLNMFLRKELFE